MFCLYILLCLLLGANPIIEKFTQVQFKNNKDGQIALDIFEYFKYNKKNDFPKYLGFMKDKQFSQIHLLDSKVYYRLQFLAEENQLKLSHIHKLMYTT